MNSYISIKSLMLCISLFFLLLSSCATVDARKCPDTEKGPSFVPDQLLIVFKKGTTDLKSREINESLKVKVLDSMLDGEITLVKIPEGSSIEEMCQRYYAFGEVEAINLNYSGIQPLK